MESLKDIAINKIITNIRTNYGTDTEFYNIIKILASDDQSRIFKSLLIDLKILYKRMVQCI